jgi:hypothetical protein
VGDARSTWGSQIDALADEFSVVARDAPGCAEGRWTGIRPLHYRSEIGGCADCRSGSVALGLVTERVLVEGESP